MPENDQIQPGFQPENQVNLQIQQSNLVQNQQQVPGNTQQLIKQDNVGTAQQELQRTSENKIQSTKKSPSWITKIISILFRILGIGLLGVGIYGFFLTSSDGYYSDHSTRDIIIYSNILLFGPLGILLILMGIFSYFVANTNAYYHPSRLTKILSGIFWFIGITLVRAGAWNFSLIPSEFYSTTKIIQIGGSITGYGILFFILGHILYSTKKWINVGFSLIYYFILLLIAPKEFEYIDYSDNIKKFFLICLIYLFILTCTWIIKCFMLKKWGKFCGKINDKQPSNKKIGIITTTILFILVICNCIYGKIQYLKLPQVDESIFQHYEHNTKLPEEKDAIIQINKALQGTGEIQDILSNLDRINMNIGNDDTINWAKHPNECDIIYSGGNSYCGTRIRNNKTLNRLLNRYINFNSIYNDSGNKNEDFLTLDGKKITILEYIDKNEPKLREFYKKMDNLTKLNYYLPDDQYLDVYTPYIQSVARGSTVMIQYYTYKEDREMVELIIKLNYKLADISKSIGGTINILIANSVQYNIDEAVNSSIKLFPKNLRDNLAEWYKEQVRTIENIPNDIAKGEYTLRKESQKHSCIHIECEPSIKQFLFHFPFNYPKDTKHLMLYSYSLIYNNTTTDNTFDEITDKLKKSLYNYDGLRTFGTLYPYITSTNKRINRNIYHKEALIDNLKAGKNQTWFSKLEWNDHPTDYEYSYQLMKN